VKLHVEGAELSSRITGYGDTWVDVGGVRHHGAVLLMPGHAVEAWPIDTFEALQAEHFARLLERAPDVVLLGTGARLRFPHPRLTAGLASRRVGVEAMDTPAACRTFNVLAGEGRHVLAILLPVQPASSPQPVLNPSNGYVNVKS